MYKFLLIVLSLSFLKCEKPAPQKPNVISTFSYLDTVNYESIAKVNINFVDSLKTDSVMINSPMIMSATDTMNTIKYSNVAKQNLLVKYTKGDSLNFAKIFFAEKNLSITLKEHLSKSDTYFNDSIKWETKHNQRTGKLTINGTWFDFLIVE